jgi:glucose-1-phosphate thymidylyltransferase
MNEESLKLDKLYVELLARGFTWLDTGTNEGLLGGAQFVETIEPR